MSKIVVALGGNALGDNPEIQMDNLEKGIQVLQNNNAVVLSTDEIYHL